MEVKKVLRKAAAIAASASFVGATLLGAMAQDLKNYPKPFVDNGVFDAFIVVGADAQPEDVVGAVDIGASLQFALKKATAVVGASDATISEGVKIQKSGNKMNYDESVSDVLEETALTEEDLPTVLADGKYVESEGDNKNNVDYSQELRFNDADTALLGFYQKKDLAPTADNYLLITKNDELYNYTLEFDSSVEYNNASSSDANNDLKTSTIAIQGKVYTITDVTLENGKIDKLTLLSGEAVLWLTQNNPITKTVNGVEHTIEVLDVTEKEDACQVKVDDVIQIVDVDNTKTINGVQIGITDVRAIHAQLQDTDVCQVSVGASEIQLIDGEKVKVDDVQMDGTKAVISDNGGEWDGFTVVYAPKDLNKDKYLASGQAYTDPVFTSWKVVFGGVTASYETYTAETSGDEDATFTFINNDGKEVELPMWLNDSTVWLRAGEDETDKILLAGKNVTITGGVDNVCYGVTTVEDCEGVKILATTKGGEAHLFTVNDINVDENTTEIYDETNGKTFKNVKLAGHLGESSALDLGSFGTGLVVKVNTTRPRLIVNSSVDVKIGTKAGGSIAIDTTSDVAIEISETNYDGDNDIADKQTPDAVTITASDSDSDEEIELDAVFDTGYTSVKKETDSDYNVLVSAVGTKVTVNTKDDNSVVVEMPKAEVYGNVFIAPIVAEVQSAGGGLSAYTLSKLNVGAAKLDSEISDASASNLIVVGGPCANKIAAKVLGNLNYPACGAASGIAENTAIIKEVAQGNGKVALVVAGWEAMDTRRATRVLSNYENYALEGASVTVTGTSLTDIKVSKSA